MSSLPFLLNWIYAVLVAGLADWLIHTEKLTKEWTRKLMSTIGLLGPALGLIALTFIGNIDFLYSFLALQTTWESLILFAFWRSLEYFSAILEFSSEFL